MVPQTFTGVAVERSTPLCVDLDGTLVKSDTLWDSVCLLVRQKPLDALQAPFWLPGGKAHFKAQIASRVQLAPETLPYNQPLLEYLRAEHRAGRKIYLATATDERTAQAIADFLGLFAGVIATRGSENLSGK